MRRSSNEGNTVCRMYKIFSFIRLSVGKFEFVFLLGYFISI